MNKEESAAIRAFMASGQPDLAMSLGPECAMAWNLRDFLKTETAHPFDWWICPARSALHMLSPDFVFDLSMDDLFLVDKSIQKINTVVNLRINILHHHDFPRDENLIIHDINESHVRKINEKYRFIFERSKDLIRKSRNPIFFLSKLRSGPAHHLMKPHFSPIGWHLTAPITEKEFASELVELVGPQARLVILTPGENLRIYPICDGAIGITFPKDLPPTQGAPDWAQPAAGYALAFSALGLAVTTT